MRLLNLNAATGLEVVSLESIPLPEPGTVRLALRAASLDHRELSITRGKYPGRPSIPSWVVTGSE